MTLSPFDVYTDYLAIVRHFISSYDYEQFNGKTRARRSSFDKRRDQFWFERIARYHDPHWLLVANLVDDPHTWIGQVARGEELAAERRGRVEALGYVLARDLERVSTDATLELGITSRDHPRLVRRVLSGEVSLEGAVAISSATGAGRLWAASSDKLLAQVGTRLVKYESFVKPSQAAKEAARCHFRKELVDRAA